MKSVNSQEIPKKRRIDGIFMQQLFLETLNLEFILRQN